MSRVFSFLIISAVLLLLDFYVFKALKISIGSLAPAKQKLISYIYWGITICTILSVLTLQFVHISALPKWVGTYIMAVFLIIFVSKFVVVFIMLFDEVKRLIFLGINYFSGEEKFDASRSKFISQLAMIAGGTLSATFVYGMVKGAYNYTIHKKKISSAKLSSVFDGFKIIQISDLHVGSFSSERPLEKAVKIINDQKPDLILFTGDLVNNVATETHPYLETLGKLKAVHGVYSVLGNHDYGDYVKWDSDQEKRQNLADLISNQEKMGWKVLIDQNVEITKEGNSFSLIGIQNWGAKARFPKYGDLTKACVNCSETNFRLLMSHDPSHWNEQVTKEFKNIDLTLSGHTHGMQFGIEIPGWIKWSPIKYMYKEWAGLYTNGAQQLYVNRGLGFLGYPGRVGISPEITVLELESLKS